MVLERVQIVIDAIIKNSKDILLTTNRMNSLNAAHTRFNKVLASNSLKNQNSAILRAGKRLDSFRGVMSMTLPQFQAFNEAGGVMVSRMGRMATGIRKATAGFKGFRMELLGVMFFGMMVMNFFKGLLRPALDAFGVMDIWQDMLTVLFLPIMEDIFPLLLSFMTWMMDLPEPVKKVIGVIALLGLALGFLLFMIGSVGLGIGSLIITFGLLPARLVAMTLSFGGAALAVSRLGIALLTMNGTAVVRELGLMMAGINRLASTALGAAAIIGIAFLAAFKISSKGLQDQGKEYTSIWNGIVGTVVDAVIGIGVLFFALGGVIKSILEIIWDSFKNTFTALGKAIWVWLSGGDFKKTFMDSMKSLDMGAIFEKNFVPAGVIASTTTGIKEKLGLIRDIPSVEVPTSPIVSSNIGSPATPSAQTIELNTVNNINVLDKLELERILDERDMKVMDELRRLSTL